MVGLIDGAAGSGTPANPSPFTRPGAVISTFTDGRGNVTTTTLDRFGAALATTDALLRTTATARDANSKATQITRANGRVDSFAYDGRGNMTSRTAALGDPLLERTTSFEYEPVFNRVTKITDPAGGETTFAYDSNGNLLTRTDALTNAASFTYNGQGLILTATDRNGEVTALTYDANGNLDTNSYDYDAYGNIEASVEGIAQPFTYTGRELDAESGLTYYRARYYDPATGRFINQDPIGFAARTRRRYRRPAALSQRLPSRR